MKKCFVIYKNKQSPEIVFEKTEFCCDGLKNLNENEDSCFYFDIVIDSAWDVLIKDWVELTEPTPVISYREPGYYGDSSLEFKKINNCPFCGSAIRILNLHNKKHP